MVLVWPETTSGVVLNDDSLNSLGIDECWSFKTTVSQSTFVHQSLVFQNPSNTSTKSPIIGQLIIAILENAKWRVVFRSRSYHHSIALHNCKSGAPGQTVVLPVSTRRISPVLGLPHRKCCCDRSREPLTSTVFGICTPTSLAISCTSLVCHPDSPDVLVGDWYHNWFHQLALRQFLTTCLSAPITSL